MTWFRKPKNPPPVAPEVCQRCGERPPVVRFQWLSGPGVGASPLGHDGAWWLCSECASAFRRGE